MAKANGDFDVCFLSFEVPDFKIILSRNSESLEPALQTLSLASDSAETVLLLEERGGNVAVIELQKHSLTFCV